jgi:hypothetical protein
MGYISYDGHGGYSQLGDYQENFIKVSDAAILQNDVYPIFTALTCGAGDSTVPGSRSLVSALVLNPIGGAIASLAPTDQSLDADAQLLGAAFVDSLLGNSMTIGNAVLDAKVQTSNSISGFMQRIYSVVGEPAVQVR